MWKTLLANPWMTMKQNRKLHTLPIWEGTRTSLVILWLKLTRRQPRQLGVERLLFQQLKRKSQTTTIWSVRQDRLEKIQPGMQTDSCSRLRARQPSLPQQSKMIHKLFRSSPAHPKSSTSPKLWRKNRLKDLSQDKNRQSTQSLCYQQRLKKEADERPIISCINQQSARWLWESMIEAALYLNSKIASSATRSNSTGSCRTWRIRSAHWVFRLSVKMKLQVMDRFLKLITVSIRHLITIRRMRTIKETLKSRQDLTKHSTFQLIISIQTRFEERKRVVTL